MNKPVKPNITIPESFAKNGIKTDFDSDLITEGFDSLKPDVLAGDNLNKFIDDTYKGLNYGMAAADAINLINEGETLTVVDGKLTSGATGGGLEVCDIGMALYVDETKGLRRYLNGQIVDINTNTQAFLNRLLKIKTTNPDYFTTEANWQAEKAMNIDGCVYKFVLNYDSTGTNVVSVRLPKYPAYIEIDNNSINNTAPVAVYGNGRGLGLVDSVNSPTYRTLIDYSYPNNIEGLVPGNLTFDHNTVFPVGTNTSNQSGYIRNVFWGVSQNANSSGLTGTASITSNFRQTKLKMRYFIQIATGQETENNITNEIELNTPSFFGDSKYVPTKVNNLSWLKSEGQSNPKGTYPSFYDWILENVNKGTKNFKGKKLYQFKGNTTETEGYIPSCSTRNPVVGTWFYGYAPIQPCAYVTQVNSDGSIVIHDSKVNKDFTLVYNQEIITLPNLLTDYDFYIDTENETFRLPLLNGSENKLGTFEPIPLPAFGSEFSNPYVNGMYEVFASKSTNDGYLYMANITTGWEVDNNTLTDGWGRVHCPASLGDTIVISTSIPEGGDRFARYAKYIGNGSLYYYVGETVQNDNLIDAGRIGEILPTKTDMQQAAKASMPSSRYIDLTLGASGATYTAPADGYFQLAVLAGNSIQFYNQTKAAFWKASSSTGIAFAESIECQAGDIIECYYDYTTFRWFRFYYAEGSK